MAASKSYNFKTPTALYVSLLLLGGFLARFVVALYLGIGTPPEPGSDSAEFDQYAGNLAEGRGYRGISPDVSDRDHLTAYRPPGLPFVWAIVVLWIGHNYIAIRLLDCIFGSVTSIVILRIGQRCFNERIAWMAAVVWAFYPTSLLYSSELLAEPLTTLLFTTYLLLTLRFADHPTVTGAVGTGIILGAAILVHPTKIFMVPLAVVWAAWQFRRQKRYMAYALLAPAVSLLLLVPWACRNYFVFGEFVPISTTGGSALLQGNNRIVTSEPGYYGYSIWDTKIPEYRDLLRAPNDELERDRVAKRLALQWLKGNPDKWLFLVQAKIRRAFTPFLQPHSPAHYRYGMLLSWGPVLILFLLAFIPTLVRFLSNSHPGWILHLGIMHFVILTVIFYGNSRYRHPVEPICIIFAAAAADLILVKLNLLPSRQDKSSG